LSERIQKRWAKHYEDGNPFDLPNSVSRGVRDAASACHHDETNPIQYLWVQFSSHDNTEVSADSRLTRDEWFGVIDEAVSMGVRFAIVSLNEPLSGVPELMSVAAWAQSTYDLMVGFHIHGRQVSRPDVRELAKMNPELTRVFVETDYLSDARIVEEIGVRVLPADGINDGDAMSSCDLPKSMTCVCSEGGLYTCGMVAGEEQYHMGNFLGRKLKAVLNDDSVPHTVREHEADASRQCSGCPPLMAQRIHEDTA